MRHMLSFAAFLAAGMCAGVEGQDRAIFSTNTDLVVLHVNVKNKRGAHVADLPQQAFAILEDGRPQTIRFFTDEDSPATVGLLVDSSASMYANRDLVIAGTAAFGGASNPRDELFALAFNERVRRAMPAATPFTSNFSLFQDALQRIIVPSGRTALFDAVAAGLDYLKQSHNDRRNLILFSDGGDNASRATLQEVTNRTQASNVVIYAVALTDADEREGNRKLLERLASATGGQAFQPRDARRIEEVLTQVAHDIRHTYTLAYVSTNTSRDGAFRHVRVVVSPPPNQTLTVRTRTGYRAALANAETYNGQLRK
jgi:Ca-activated chloride channel homolog